jgi:hypothetical protein
MHFSYFLKYIINFYLYNLYNIGIFYTQTDYEHILLILHKKKSKCYCVKSGTIVS